MTIIVSYRVDFDLYLLQATNRDTTLITTEYKHKNNILAHTQLNEKTAARINDSLSADHRLKKPLESEMFFSGKTYSEGNIKPISKKSFGAKLNKLPKNEVEVSTEYLENYAYIDKNGTADEVKIVITQMGNKITAMIDFKGSHQYEFFTPPNWLCEYEK